METNIQINVKCTTEVLDKFLLYYPNRESIADEVLRQISESKCLLTGEPLILKYRKYKGGAKK